MNSSFTIHKYTQIFYEKRFHLPHHRLLAHHTLSHSFHLQTKKFYVSLYLFLISKSRSRKLVDVNCSVNFTHSHPPGLSLWEYHQQQRKVCLWHRARGTGRSWRGRTGFLLLRLDHPGKGFLPSWRPGDHSRLVQAAPLVFHIHWKKFCLRKKTHRVKHRSCKISAAIQNKNHTSPFLIIFIYLI